MDYFETIGYKADEDYKDGAVVDMISNREKAVAQTDKGEVKMQQEIDRQNEEGIGEGEVAESTGEIINSPMY